MPHRRILQEDSSLSLFPASCRFFADWNAGSCTQPPVNRGKEVHQNPLCAGARFGQTISRHGCSVFSSHNTLASAACTAVALPISESTEEFPVSPRRCRARIPMDARTGYLPASSPSCVVGHSSRLGTRHTEDKILENDPRGCLPTPQVTVWNCPRRRLISQHSKQVILPVPPRSPGCCIPGWSVSLCQRTGCGPDCSPVGLW